jgi:hypothetical protein
MALIDQGMQLEEPPSTSANMTPSHSSGNGTTATTSNSDLKISVQEEMANFLGKLFFVRQMDMVLGKNVKNTYFLLGQQGHQRQAAEFRKQIHDLIFNYDIFMSENPPKDGFASK